MVSIQGKPYKGTLANCGQGESWPPQVFSRRCVEPRGDYFPRAPIRLRRKVYGNIFVPRWVDTQRRSTDLAHVGHDQVLAVGKEKTGQTGKPDDGHLIRPTQ